MRVYGGVEDDESSARMEGRLMDSPPSPWSELLRGNPRYKRLDGVGTVRSLT